MVRLGAVTAVALLSVLDATDAGVHNITVYRITPRNYTGLTDLDTGDAAGDAFFGLYEKAAPALCRDESQASSLLCNNDALLQIPGFNVYLKVIVEADDRFGEYSKCNPSQTPPHNFYCEIDARSCWCTLTVIVFAFGFFKVRLRTN